VVVAERTLNRYIGAKFPKSDQSTVRVADGEPGSELQVDSGELGLMFDDESGRRRKVWAFVEYAQAHEPGALHHAITADTTGPDQHRTPQPTAA
jgi:hypothetical protein